MGTLMACPYPTGWMAGSARRWSSHGRGKLDGELTLLDADGTVLARFDPRLDR